MRARWLRCAVMCWVALSGGCYTVHVKSVVRDDNGGTKPVSEGPPLDAESATVVSWLWGLYQPADLDEARCNGNGFAHVRSETNLGFSLVSVVTLGIVMPQSVAWRCATDRQVEPSPR